MSDRTFGHQSRQATLAHNLINYRQRALLEAGRPDEEPVEPQGPGQDCVGVGLIRGAAFADLEDCQGLIGRGQCLVNER